MPHRLNLLWYSPLLPLLFYVSSIMAGLALAIMVYQGAARFQARPVNPQLIQGLGQGLGWITLLYLLLKVGEIILAGELPALLALDRLSWRWLLELGVGGILPILLWLFLSARHSVTANWVIPTLVLMGVLLNRFNATMFAQVLPPGTTYSPHILEWLSTLGILAGVALAWYLGVRFLATIEDKG
jgi:Ni/Fe-hydrogenase subunit HybB-like protein